MNEAAAAATDLVPTRALSGATLGPFRLVELVGRGGMAEVWRAEWLVAPGAVRIVALKRALPEICARRDLAELFSAEVALALRLDHPHIVRGLHAGEVHGQPFLAMELLDGVDLRTVLRAAAAKLPMAFAVHVTRALCDALHYLHELRDDDGAPLSLIHRDVSPANLMIGRDGTIKLCDFGVAKALGERPYDVTSLIKGKWGYMAPELMTRGWFDRRVDVYAAGVMLYELLTHRRLFPGRRRLAIGGAPLALAPPSTINAEVPPRLDAIVLRALAHDPAERYGGADELAADLAELGLDARWSPAATAALLARVVPVAAAPTGSARDDGKVASTLRATADAVSPPSAEAGEARTPAAARDSATVAAATAASPALDPAGAPAATDPPTLPPSAPTVVFVAAEASTPARAAATVVARQPAEPVTVPTRPAAAALGPRAFGLWPIAVRPSRLGVAALALACAVGAGWAAWHGAASSSPAWAVTEPLPSPRTTVASTATAASSAKVVASSPALPPSRSAPIAGSARAITFADEVATPPARPSAIPAASTRPAHAHRAPASRPAARAPLTASSSPPRRIARPRPARVIDLEGGPLVDPYRRARGTP